MNRLTLSSADTLGRCWALAAHHRTEAVQTEDNPELRAYHEGKAFAYEHAARMLEGTDAS